MALVVARLDPGRANRCLAALASVAAAALVAAVVAFAPVAFALAAFVPAAFALREVASYPECFLSETCAA